MRLIVSILVLCLSLFDTRVLAQESAGDLRSDEFEILRQGGGFVRLNRKSGVLSYCRVVTGNLVCRAAADEREAYLDALDRLGERLDNVENRVTALEEDNQKHEAVDQVTKPADTSANSGRPVAILAADMVRRFFAVVAVFREKLETDSR